MEEEQRHHDQQLDCPCGRATQAGFGDPQLGTTTTTLANVLAIPQQVVACT
jgi:hypothetical protein